MNKYELVNRINEVKPLSDKVTLFIAENLKLNRAKDPEQAATMMFTDGKRFDDMLVVVGTLMGTMLYASYRTGKHSEKGDESQAFVDMTGDYISEVATMVAGALLSSFGEGGKS